MGFTRTNSDSAVELLFIVGIFAHTKLMDAFILMPTKQGKKQDYECSFFSSSGGISDKAVCYSKESLQGAVEPLYIPQPRVPQHTG